MTYTQWLQCLTEAEQRAKNDTDAGVRERSTETVGLIMSRLKAEGITRAELVKLAKDEK